MNDDLLKYQIGITLIKGIGPNLAKNLIAYLGGVEAVFREKKQNLAKIPGIGEVLSNEISSQDVMKRAEEEIAFIQKNKIGITFFMIVQFKIYCFDKKNYLCKVKYNRY